MFAVALTWESHIDPYRGKQEVKDALIAKGVFHEVFFTPQGPGGIFAFYAAPGSSLGQMFINEFVCVSSMPCRSRT